jgi:L-histidine Nalpha-methyltransferase
MSPLADTATGVAPTTLPVRVAQEFVRDVREGLQKRPKRVPSRYFYDALGSHLFEAICQLPWYKVTRAESALLARHAADVFRHFAQRPALVELGCGSGEKVALLCQPLADVGAPLVVHLVDISATALDLSERTLSRIPGIRVVTHCERYERGLRQAAERVPSDGPIQVLFLGSNLGNFAADGASAFLAEIRACLRPGDGLLLGADLVKPEAELLRAYSDPLGVTAAFNKNLLLRLNVEMGADFDLDAFEHRALYRPETMCVESHLVSLRHQKVRVPAAELELELAEGETIWTESSHKYTPGGIVQMGRVAGFDCPEQWIEQDGQFCLSQLLAV